MHKHPCSVCRSALLEQAQQAFPEEAAAFRALSQAPDKAAEQPDPGQGAAAGGKAGP